MSAATPMLRATSATEKLRLVYVLSASHSGSTLTSMLLGSHPEACTVGELKLNTLGDLNSYRCSCKQVILKCPFWSDIAQSMRQRGFNFHLDDAGTDVTWRSSRWGRRILRPLHRGRLLEYGRDVALSLSPAWRSALPQVLSRNKALLEAISEHTGARIIIDSSKVGIRLKYLLRIPDIDMRVVRLVRDGRAVALTYVDPAQYADAADPTLREGGHGGTRESEKLSFAQAAREWRRSNEEAEKAVSALPAYQHTVVRYEELCSDPKGTLERLFRFIGVDPALAPADFRASEHHVVGNGMRLDSNSDIRLDDRWRHILSASQLNEFEAIAGGLNRRLGYTD